MTLFVHSFSSRHVLCLDHKGYETIRELKIYLKETKSIPMDSSFLICNGSLVDDDDPVQENVVYHTYLKILGGKGGFGSMLRAIGAQIEKTTNHEACRDLSGRRMRDVNYEKDLKEWLAKKVERDREKEQRRQERMARRRAMPNHKFDDPVYEKQREILSENQDDALQKGLQKVATVAVTSTDPPSGKRKAETVTSSTVSKKKKGTEWLGIDSDVSDLDSEGEEEQNESSDSPEPNIPINPELSMSDMPGTSGMSGSSDINSASENKHTNGQSTNINTSGDLEQGPPKSYFDGNNTEDKLSEPKSFIDEKEMELNKEVNQSTIGISVEGEVTIKCLTEIETPVSGEVPQEKEFCLDNMRNVTDVQSFGMEVLKAELMRRGLKCGGTLEQRAERLFSVKGLEADKIDPSLFAKSNGKNIKKKKP